MLHKKWYNNFSIGVILAALLALGISIFCYFKLHELLELFNWASSNTAVMALMAAPYLITFASRLVSGAGYLMKPLDVALADNTVLEITTKLDQLKADIKAKAIRARIQRNKGYFTGNVLGIFVSVGTTILQVIGKAVTYASVFGPLAIPLLALDNAGTDAGFFSRILWVVESFFDREKGKFSITAFMDDQRLNARLGIIGSFVVAVGLLAFTALTMATPVGPLAIALTAASFIGVMGSSASAGEYIGDVADVFFGPRTVFGYVKDLIVGNKPSLNISNALTGDRKHEYRGKLIGIGVAVTVIAVAATLIALHIVCPPTIGITFILGLCVTSFSAFPGIFGRIMKTFDIKNAELAKAENPEIIAQSPESEKDFLLINEEKLGISERPEEILSPAHSTPSSSFNTPRSFIGSDVLTDPNTPRSAVNPNAPTETENLFTPRSTATSSSPVNASSLSTPRDPEDPEIKNKNKKDEPKEISATGSSSAMDAAISFEPKPEDISPVLFVTPSKPVDIAAAGTTEKNDETWKKAPPQQFTPRYGLSSSQPLPQQLTLGTETPHAVRRSSTPPPVFAP